MAMQYTQDRQAARERAKAMHKLLMAGMTLTEVGAVYDITRERVRQIVGKHFPSYVAKRGRPKLEAQK